jgi:hypothetical protein
LQSFLFFLPGLRRAMQCAQRISQYTGEKDRKIAMLHVVFAQILTTIDQFQDKNMRLWVVGMETRQITAQFGGFGVEESIHRCLPRNGWGFVRAHTLLQQIAGALAAGNLIIAMTPGDVRHGEVARDDMCRIEQLAL